MKRLNILAAFELEINKLDDAVNKPVTDDSLYWLNQATMKFVKERFNGNAPHFTSYEQNEKRTRDLHNLFESYQMQQIGDVEHHSTYDEYFYSYPEDMMYLLSERVLITDNQNEHEYDTSIFECTADSFMYRVTNSLTDFHYKYHKARPLRVRTGKPDSYTVSLLTDGNYKINDYRIYYLRVPEQITDENPDDVDVEYKDFEDDVWHEIIKTAAQMYVENQSDQRYRTLTNEVLTQE